jgi:hypothetical protein
VVEHSRSALTDEGISILEHHTGYTGDTSLLTGSIEVLFEEVRICGLDGHAYASGDTSRCAAILLNDTYDFLLDLGRVWKAPNGLYQHIDASPAVLDGDDGRAFQDTHVAGLFLPNTV